MYLYETHCHTTPVSRCSHASVAETLEYYHRAKYDGVFITNHFLDGNIGIDASASYREKLDFFFSDYRNGVELGKKIGIKVFCGAELSFDETDFLIFGLPQKWYYDHPECVELPKSKLLPQLMASGALVVQAHPFREASYIDHIRLFPRCVHAVETYNACNCDFFNEMAKHYAESYRLLPFAGSDNHSAGNNQFYGGMMAETPIFDEADFVRKVLKKEMRLFRRVNGEDAIAL